MVTGISAIFVIFVSCRNKTKTLNLVTSGYSNFETRSSDYLHGIMLREKPPGKGNKSFIEFLFSSTFFAHFSYSNDLRKEGKKCIE